MATYEYSCESCGAFPIELTMGTAPSSLACVHCGAQARRRYSAPHLSRLSAPIRQAVARAERSRDEPEVVTRVPPRAP